MAAGDRNRNGKATDIVRHKWGSNYIKHPSIGGKEYMVWDGKTICGRSDVGWATHDGWGDVTCLKCLKYKPKES